MVSKELKNIYNEFPINIKAYLISNELAPESRKISPEILPTYEDYERIRAKCIRLCKGRDTLQSKCSDYLKNVMRFE